MEQSLKISVFTTKAIIEKFHDIMCIYHDEEGDWQFQSNLENDDSPAIASLEQIIEIDSSVKELLDLPNGYSASRKSINDKWEIHKL